MLLFFVKKWSTTQSYFVEFWAKIPYHPRMAVVYFWYMILYLVRCDSTNPAPRQGVAEQSGAVDHASVSEARSLLSVREGLIFVPKERARLAERAIVDEGMYTNSIPLPFFEFRERVSTFMHIF